jgi:Cu/Ag efflux pump CusA
MFRLPYPMAAALALALLVVGGIGGYFLARSWVPADTTGTTQSEQPSVPDDKDAKPPELPPRDRQAVVIEVIAAYPGSAVEEVERQVTVPLEVALADMPRLQSLRSTSVAGLCGVYARFEPGTDYGAARQEIINRLQLLQQLPAGVVPQIGPGPSRHALRYVLINPKDPAGRPIYSLNDLKTLQDWVLEREFRRLPGVANVCGSGGTVKRYEVQPAPDRLHRYGVTLQQLSDAIAAGNANVGGEIFRGTGALNVRVVGLLGGGVDAMSGEVLNADDARKAAGLLRAAEERRLGEVRSLVVATVNNKRVTVEDLVGERGVVIGSQPRAGWVACSGPGASEEEDVVQGVVLLRTGEGSRRLVDVQARIRELNTTAGKLLPGVRIEPYHASTDAERSLWVHGTFPVNASLKEAATGTRKVRQQLRQLPEVEHVVSQAGRSEDGADLLPANQVRIFVGLKAGLDRGRTPAELLAEINRLLSRELPGIDWLATAKGPEELEGTFPGVNAENLLAVLGPDLDELEHLAGRVRDTLRAIEGVENVAAYRCLGQAHLEFRVDLGKCARWGVRTADVSAALQTALGGKTISQMVEGDKTFDITVRWPPQGDDETAILDLPFAADSVPNAPRLRLRDLVSPVNEEGKRPAAAVIYRVQGTRSLPVRFSVHGRSLADVRAEAEKKIAPLLKAPYRIEWAE